MAAAEEELVRRLRRVQDAYEHDTSLSLCSTLLSLGSHISSVPDFLLVKLWMSVKDETLKQLHLYNRKTKQCDSTAEPDKVNINQLIQTIDLFLGQCPDLPFDLFWEECVREFIQISTPKETEVAMCNLYHARELLQGLLHLMATNCSCESPFSNPKFEEASLTKLHILLRLTLEQNDDDGELLLTTKLFPMWSTIKNTQLGFQIILKLLQREASCTLDVTQPAEQLLKDLFLANEEEWTGCLASLLHQILQAYLEKGPTFLEQKPTRALLRLFSSQTFAHTFLDCITLNPDPHRSSAREMVRVCLMKARDQDEKVRLMAFQTLRKIPMKTLVECLSEADWNAICKRGFSEDKNDIRGVVEVLLLDYITTDVVAETPSARLRMLNLVGEGDRPQQHFSFVYDNVDSIWNRELEYLNAILNP